MFAPFSQFSVLCFTLLVFSAFLISWFQILVQFLKWFFFLTESVSSACLPFFLRVIKQVTFESERHFSLAASIAIFKRNRLSSEKLAPLYSLNKAAYRTIFSKLFWKTTYFFKILGKHDLSDVFKKAFEDFVKQFHFFVVKRNGFIKIK